MLSSGDPAPDFTAPLVGEETEPFRLSNRTGDGPVVLAFFPAAFSSTCTVELQTFRDDYDAFADHDATVFGISTDLPYALSRFRETNALEFHLVSDNDGAISEAYDVIEAWDHIALSGVAQRAVFVIDPSGVVRYVWRADSPSEEPDYDEVIDAVETVA
jgi:peroxiredoxin